MVSGISSSSGLMTAIMAKLTQSSQTSTSSKNIFNKLDINGDGSVTADELASSLSSSGSDSASKAASLVKAADQDNDNALSESELSAFLTQLTSGGLSGSNNAQLASNRDQKSLLSIADTNGDGSLSKDEFSAAKPDDVSTEMSDKLFASADTNSDGSLSSDEVTAFESNATQGGMKGAMMGPPPPPPSDSDDDEDDTTISSILSQLIDSLTSSSSTDDASDTTTAAASTTSNQDKVFSFFDKDGDGTVSEDELNTGVSALKTAMTSYLLSLQENRAAA